MNRKRWQDIRNYSTAYLELVKEKKQVKENQEYVSAFFSLLNSNEDFYKYITSSEVKKTDKRDIINDLFSANVLFKNWIQILLNYGLMSSIKDTLDYTLIEINKFMSISNGYIWSTYKLSSSEFNTILSTLEKKLQKNIFLFNKIDTTLIRGFRVEINDYILDNSIKNKLFKLREKLIN